MGRRWELGDAAGSHALAEAVREACVTAALEGYENASMLGLCHEGAWEAAVSAIRMVDLRRVIGADATAIPVDVAAALLGLICAGAIERTTGEHAAHGPAASRQRARALTSRLQALRSALGAWIETGSAEVDEDESSRLPRSLEVGERCAQVAHCAAEAGSADDGASDAALGLWLGVASQAAESAFEQVDDRLAASGVDEATRRARRRIWRARLTLHRARARFARSGESADG